MKLLFGHNLSRHLRRIRADFYPYGGKPGRAAVLRRKGA